jgi:predicted nucleotidyltransferase
MDLPPIRAQVQAWAASKPRVRTVWLIGSRAKGTHGPDSDIDLAVAYRPPPDSDAFMNEALDWEDELQAVIPYRVHMLTCRRSRGRVWRGAKSGASFSITDVPETLTAYLPTLPADRGPTEYLRRKGISFLAGLRNGALEAAL